MAYICHHCGENFRRDQADRWAQSKGYISYEDRAAHLGITIADDHEPPKREY